MAAADHERSTADAEAWASGSAAETESIGAALAAALEPGDVILLRGPLGAGKTRLVAGIARALSGATAVRSPTFTLVNEYSGRLPLIHVDLYRLDPGEVRGLGLDEYRERGVLAIEWGEKAPAALREEALELDLEIVSGEERAIRARAATPAAASPRAAALLQAWKSARAASGRGG